MACDGGRLELLFTIATVAFDNNGFRRLCSFRYSYVDTVGDPINSFP
jgi:hypothetical protein